MKVNNISTRVMVNISPEKVWDYLCDAHMPTAAPWCFKLAACRPRKNAG